MRFGKNIKLASILDYKEDSLVFVKYALLDKNCKPIFDTGNYSIHNTNEGIGMVYNLAKKEKLDRLYLIENQKSLLDLSALKLYTDKELNEKINKLNERTRTK